LPPGVSGDGEGIALPPEEPAVLEMRTACERCHTALPLDGDARICSYECTFCPACTETMSGRCPNCGGELLPRPRRTSADRTGR
jgi:uncharacterized protein